MIQCSVTTVIRHPIQSISHYSPGQRWMSGDDERNDCLFALSVNIGILGTHLVYLREWYVYILTKQAPQPILHAVQYS